MDLSGLLMEKPEGMQAKDILAYIPQATELSEYEMGYYPSTPNSPRIEKIIRFATIGCVKAGWQVKEKGRWYITDEGRGAYQQFPDPEV